MPNIWANAQALGSTVPAVAPIRDRPARAAQCRIAGAHVGRHRSAVPPSGACLGAGLVDHRDGGERASRHREARRAAQSPGRRLQALRHTTGGLRGALDGEGARVAEALGADIIDINMGCPAREVTGKLSGSALMRDLDHAASLIEAVVGAVDGARHAEDAARLGPRQPQRAGAGAAARKRPASSCSPCMRARAASSSRATPTGAFVRQRQGGRAHSRRRQRRHRRSRHARAPRSRPPAPTP